MHHKSTDLTPAFRRLAVAAVAVDPVVTTSSIRATRQPLRAGSIRAEKHRTWIASAVVWFADAGAFHNGFERRYRCAGWYLAAWILSGWRLGDFD